MSIVVHIASDGAYRKTQDLDAALALIGAPNTVLWVDSTERNAQLESVLRDRLKIHPLAIEDIYSDYMSPKIEDYGDCLYVVMHGVRRDGEDPEALGTIEIDIVIGTNWVFTHHTLPMRSVEGLEEELARNARVLARGPAAVAHALMDRLTDHYLPVVDKFDDEISDLEKSIIDDPNSEILQRIFAVKRSLQRLRRISVYQRDILMRLARGEFALIPESARPFFRDVFDHFVRIADLADSYRELVGSSLEMYMSVTANRTNEIMKALALISTIMLPLTFVAGVYGMNFEHMPELKWKYGYAFALGMMAAITSVLIYWFKRRRWL